MTDPLRSFAYCEQVGPTRWGECAGCRAPLPRRADGRPSMARVWCGQDCMDRWARDHVWTIARGHAMRLAAPPPSPGYPWRIEATCRRCGAPAVEVDHIVPRNGAGYGSGCHHHQSNLQPLCGPCHVVKGVVYRAITKALEAASRSALPAGWVPPPVPPEAVPLPLWGDA